MKGQKKLELQQTKFLTPFWGLQEEPVL